jgi:hypothetical protein
MIKQVKPRTVSEKDRQRAIDAMAQQQANEAAVIDARMLEMLSDNFLYPSLNRKTNSGPRGRPEMVPGAMSYETMLNYRKRAEAAKQGKISIQSYIGDGNNNDQQSSFRGRGVAMTPKRGRGRPKKVESEVPPRKKVVKGSRKTEDDSKSPKSEEEGPVKKRKRVVKNLPAPRSRNKNGEEEEPPPMTFGSTKKGGRKQSVAADLQRYYRTELLTAKEEYLLGTKVQYMVKCENVHEGLAIRLERLPTILEWAHACG